MKTKIGIVGYGNLGKAVEILLQNSEQYELVAIFSRRKRQNIQSEYKTKICAINEIEQFKNKIDIMIICVGSFSDCEKIAAKLIKNFNIIDCFDTHSKILDHFITLNKKAIRHSKIALSGFGWDPGILSLIRAIFASFNNNSSVHTFWGKGVSQGHSETLRKISGIENAIQFTIPRPLAMLKCKTTINAKTGDLQKHKRLCYLKLKNTEEKDEIKNQIANTENYFKNQKLKIKFANAEKIKKLQKHLYHKGYIFSNFHLLNYKNFMQFKLKIDSNPIFTANIMIMGINAINKLKQAKDYGCKNILTLPITHLFPDEQNEILSKYL